MQKIRIWCLKIITKTKQETTNKFPKVKKRNNNNFKVITMQTINKQKKLQSKIKMILLRKKVQIKNKLMTKKGNT
jgi:hypothetical protein